MGLPASFGGSAQKRRRTSSHSGPSPSPEASVVEAWMEASAAEPLLCGAEQAASAPAGGGASAEGEELRIDDADGQAYSRDSFIEAYGYEDGLQAWGTATPARALAPSGSGSGSGTAVAGLPPRRLSLLRPAPAADNVRAASATSALRDGGLPPPTSYAGRGW